MLSVDIHKTLDSFRLHVSFEAGEETLALLGASGCGKSMTLKCIAGIERPDSGRIVLNGRTLFDSERRIDLAPQKRRVGYLFQQYALFPNMTIEQNVAAGCRERDRTLKKRLVAERICSMRLAGLESKRPAELSGGQQQRVALARILINEPELLLLDEPFAALDSYLKWQLELELAETLRGFGRGALFVSHSRGEVRRLCENVCVLSAGRSEEKQPVGELFGHPRTLAAAELSGCRNFSRIRRLDDARVEALDWGARLRLSRPLTERTAFVGALPQNLALSERPAGENSFPCTLEQAAEDAFSTAVTLRAPGPAGSRSLLWAAVERGRWEELAGCAGPLYVTIAPPALLLLEE